MKRVKVSAMTLRNFYKYHGIGFRNVQVVYRRSLEQEERLDPLRKECALAVTSLIMKGYPVIYLDESSFNSHLTQSKAWSFAQNPVLAITPRKYNAVTVFGAIGSCIKGNGVFMLAESTNAADFAKFLKKIKSSMKAPYKSMKPVLVMDNAAAHKERLVATPTLKSLFTPFFTPPYSCTLNSKW